MKKVVLVFPNPVLMAEFILTYKIKKAESNSIQSTVVAYMTEQHISIACEKYEAIVKQISRV